MNPKTQILVVDDELSIRKSIVLALSNEEYDVLDAGSRPDVLQLLGGQSFDLIVSDLFVPTEADGMAIIEACKDRQPQAMVMVMTAHGSIERAVAAVKAGADDFIEKGFTMEELKLRVDRLLAQKRLRDENLQLTEQYDQLRSEVEGRYRFEEIVGNSKPIRELLALVSRVVDDPDATVLLQGESGTGKELVARAIHYNGPRKDQPFVLVSCATLPEHLLESELFGFVKGAFTGASKDKPGKFEIGDGGTVFIDEVGELSPKVQVELLRFTQDRTFERVGSNQPRTVDVRIVAASNRNLQEEVANGRFRQDLFYRLNVLPIHIPPLRDRKEEIPLLVDYFVEKFRDKKGRVINFSQGALARLHRHDWPGNVRELENLVERLVVTAPQPTILPGDLPAEFFDIAEKEAFAHATSQHSLKQACQEFEKQLILRELENHQWNISEVARVLGERRDTLSRKIKRLGLKSSLSSRGMK